MKQYDSNEVYLFIENLIDGCKPENFEKLEELKEKLTEEIGYVFQDYSDDVFEGQCL